MPDDAHPAATQASGHPARPPALSPGYRIERIVEGSGFHTLNGVAFGPDGRLFAASMSGESIFALDLATGRIETIIDPPLGESDDLIFTAGGDIIWTAVLEGIVRKRDRHGRISDLARDLPGVNSLALTRDGTRLFMGQVFLGEGLYEIDLEGVKAPRLVLAKTGGLNAFQFGADGMIYGPSWLNGTVLRIDPESGEHQIIARGFTKPGAVRFDSQEQLYVLDDAPGELFHVNPADGTKRLIARLATATDNFMVGPDDLMYVSNMVDNSVHEVNPRTGSIHTIVQGKLGFPRAIAVASSPQGDMIHVADCSSYRVVDPRTGGIEDVARAVISEVRFPNAVSANEDHIVLTCEFFGTVQILERAGGKILHEIKGFEKPGDAIELGDGSLIVTEPAAGRVLRVVARVLPILGYRHDVLVEGLDQPCGLADAHDGTIYVAESASGRLLRVSVPEGHVSEVATGLGAIRAVAVAPDGTLITLDNQDGTLFSVDPNNGGKEVIARHLPVGYLRRPYARSGGIAVGSDGTIYVAADRENAIDRIVRI